MRRATVFLFMLLMLAVPARADLKAAVDTLAAAKLGELEAAIKAVAAEPGPLPAQILTALAEGNLYIRKADRLVVIAAADGDMLKLVDAATGSDAGSAAKGDLVKIKINNALRRVIKAAAGGSALASPAAAKRLEAARSIFKATDAAALASVEAALTTEADPAVWNML